MKVRAKRTILFLAVIAAMINGSIVRGDAPLSGFNLSWNQCTHLPNAAQNLDYACDGSRNGSLFRLVFSFVTAGDLPAFVGLQAVFDVKTPDDWLANWWQLGIGECREGALSFPARLTGIGSGTTGLCVNPWLGSPTGGGYQWTSNAGCCGSPSPGRGQLKIAFARETETALIAGQSYLGGVITLDPSLPGFVNLAPMIVAKFGQMAGPQGESSPTDNPCSGCGVPACIALNQVELYQTVGSPGGDIVILKFPTDHGFVTWQGGAIGGGGCPAEVPVKRATWGAIKAIYR